MPLCTNLVSHHTTYFLDIQPFKSFMNPFQYFSILFLKHQTQTYTQYFNTDLMSATYRSNATFLLLLIPSRIIPSLLATLHWEVMFNLPITTKLFSRVTAFQNTPSIFLIPRYMILHLAALKLARQGSHEQ